MKRLVHASLSVALLGLLASSAAADSFFDIFTELSVSGGPYPTHALGGSTGKMNSDGKVMPDGGFYHAGLGAANDGASDLPMRMRSLTSAPDGRSFAVDSFFDITYDIAPGGPAFPVDSFFDVFFDITTGPDGSPARLLPVNDAPRGTPDSFFDVFITDSFFDITYRVMFDEGNIKDIHLRGIPGAGLRVRNVKVAPRNAACCDSFFDIFTELTLQPGKTVPGPGSQILWIHQTGSLVESPVETAPSSWGAIKARY